MAKELVKSLAKLSGFSYGKNTIKLIYMGIPQAL